MRFKQTIQQNARKIVELYSRVNETAKYRNDRPEQNQKWANACSAFHANYSRLAFIGGVATARERLREGNTEAIEYAISFLEVRPYFFRSGYMYNDFMRVLRNCPLTAAQRRRYDKIHLRYRVYRDRKNLAREVD